MKKNCVQHFLRQRRALIMYIIMMKAVWILILVSVFEASGGTGKSYSQNTKLNLQLKDATLEEVIWNIKEKTEFDFFYNSEDISQVRGLNIQLKNSTASEILDVCLENSSLTYEIVNKVIIIRQADKKVPPPLLIPTDAEQPKLKKISGTVTDNKGEPIPGTSLFIKGTTTGTVTSSDGSFTLEVPLDARTLTVSFIGFKTKEINLGTLNELKIELAEDVVGVDEVVVVGYGTQTKASVVGAISSVKADEIKSIATSNLTNTIGGYVSGVITKSGEGKPGEDDAQIFIRGRATTNSTSPLILVDGIESDFGRINPNDIESFSVLKDASATAVYGVRGANGVILITTKRGSAGKPKIEVTSQFRLHKIINYPKFLGAYDFARLYNEAYRNAGNSSNYFSDEDLNAYRDHTDPYGHPDVNWFKAMTKPYFLEHRHDISIKGGTPKVKYYVSGELVSQDGAYKQWDDQKYKTNSTYDRINLRMNFDFEVTKSTDLNLNVSNRIENTNDVQSGTVGEVSTRVGLWDEIAGISAINNPLENPDGSFGYYSGFGRELLPYAQLRQGGFQKGRANFLQASFQVNQKLNFITKGLSFRFMGGMNTTSKYVYKLDESPAIWYYNAKDESYTEISRPNLPTVSVGSDNINQLFHVESAFSYDRTFNKLHKITALLLYNQDRRIYGADAPINHLGAASRVTYAYNNKYLGEVNMGYNGSDQFQKGERFAFLPAASLGWVASEESFVKENLPFIKYLKVRGSYGTAGNDKLGNFAYLYKSVYYRKTNALIDGYYFGNTANGGVSSILEGSLGNDRVTWEIAKKQNYGLDFNLFTQDLGFSIDYFREDRSNILTQRNTITQVFGVPGGSLPPENIGQVKNQGFEIEARYNKKVNNWDFHFSGNVSYAKNTIIDIDEVKQVYDYMNRTGKPIGQHFGYLWSGEFYSYEDLGYVWDASAEAANKYVLPEGAVPRAIVPMDKVSPGELKFVDRNNDGVIDSYDVGAIGKSATPNLIYGLNLGVNYKRFSLQMFWQGASGFSVDLGQTPLLTEFKNGGTAHEIHLGRWAYFPDQGIDTRETATYPRLMFNGAPQTQKTSSFKVLDCNYIRLKNVELSYSLPDNFVHSLKMDFARVYLVGNNLLTFDNIGYIDPESPGSAAAYPQSLFVGMGINIGF